MNSHSQTHLNNIGGLKIPFQKNYDPNSQMTTGSSRNRRRLTKAQLNPNDPNLH